MSVTATHRRSPSIEDVDQRVFMHDVSWKEYEVMLAVRGEAAGPRLTYLDRELELMSPSRTHEAIATLIGRLLEIYAEERGIVLEGYGSMTVRSAPRTRGVEPDKCYAVGAPKETPDLAIEVIWTSGGIDKLAVYAGLGIREVWICGDDRLAVHALRGGVYVEVTASELLPGLDLSSLAAHLRHETQTEAVTAFRASLRR